MTKQLNFFAFLLVIFTVTSCSMYEEVEMLGVQGYNFERVENSQVKASIVVKVNNPNFYSIKLKKSDFQVFLDDKMLGNAGMAEDIKIIKKTEQDYTLNLLLNENDIQNAALPLIKKALFKKTITFRIKGKAHCKVWGILGKKIDINETKEISIKELISNFKM